MIDNLKFLFNSRCEMGRSSLAATNRDNVLSSGINNCLLLAEEFWFVVTFVPTPGFDSFALARSIKMLLSLRLY